MSSDLPAESMTCADCAITVAPVHGCCPSCGRVLDVPPAALQRVGLVLQQRWSLEHVLGLGGFATVFGGRDLHTQAAVAVKVLNADRASDSDAVARFVNEAQVLGLARHPNVVALLGAGCDPVAGQYIAMPLLQGCTLGQRVAVSGACTPAEVSLVLSGVLQALSHIHGLGLVHRDIKTENVFLQGGSARRRTPAKDAILLDFGVAKMIPPENPNAHRVFSVTRPQQVVGSAWSMAPEQVLSDRIDARTDLYSLGILLFEMLTGGVPFRADRPGLVMRAHVHEPAPPPSERLAARWVPPEVDRFVLELLAKEPRHRPTDALTVWSRWQDLQPLVHAAWARHVADQPASGS